LRWRWVAVVMADKDGPRSPRFSEKFAAVIRNPNINLDAMYVGWEDNKNPYYAWSAIEICTKHKKPLPTWVVDYLAGCAERMLSDKATKSKDLRKILPSILGFPAKRGPGRPLDPDHVPNDKLMFALLFTIEIHKGRKPSIARKDAMKHLPRNRADRIDDKTLQRWLKEVFDLTSSPRTVTKWKSVMRRHYGAFETLFRETLP
jgi:hypothetical protein